MAYKILTLFMTGALFSTELKASEEQENSPPNYAKKHEELDVLPQIHNYEEIFDNYGAGGSAPNADDLHTH